MNHRPGRSAGGKRPGSLCSLHHAAAGKQGSRPGTPPVTNSMCGASGIHIRLVRQLPGCATPQVPAALPAGRRRRGLAAAAGRGCWPGPCNQHARHEQAPDGATSTPSQEWPADLQSNAAGLRVKASPGPLAAARSLGQHQTSPAWPESHSFLPELWCSIHASCSNSGKLPTLMAPRVMRL